MKKIGFLELNNDAAVDEGKPHYVGEINTRYGVKRITAYAGRDKDFNDYLSCWIPDYNGRNLKFRATTLESNRLGDHYANISLEKVVQLTFKRVFNENGNIVVSFDIIG